MIPESIFLSVESVFLLFGSTSEADGFDSAVDVGLLVSFPQADNVKAMRIVISAFSVLFISSVPFSPNRSVWCCNCSSAVRLFPSES